MIPRAVEYVRPASLQAALELLAQQDGDFRPLAGGHSLLPMMKLRLAAPDKLVDIARLEELKGIQVDDRRIWIGAATTHAQIEQSDQLAQQLPLFRQVASVIADATVRNRGTIGGALSHADPSADWPAAMLALNARMHIANLRGVRTVRASEYFRGLFETALEPGEVLKGVEIEVPGGKLSTAYSKFRHPASGYAVAAAAVALRFASGSCAGGSLAITGVSTHAFRLENADKHLKGFSGSAEEIERVVVETFEGREVLEDRFADEAYRLQLAKTMVRRALTSAFRAHGSQ